MPIKRRDPATIGLQVPAIMAKPHVPSPNAKLTNVPNKDLRTAGFFTYGGTDPMTIPVDDLTRMIRNPQNDADMDRAYRNRIRSKATAIRAFCVLNLGSAKAVRLCSNVGCALWPFRMGNNPLNRKS